MNTSPHTQSNERPLSLGRIISYILFGVCLPAFTLGFEMVTGFSDQIYINPIPSILHVIMIAIVPIILAFGLFRLASKQSIGKIDLFFNSICIAVTMVYAIIYLPILPFAAIGVIAYGLAFLPLSPIIALLCVYRMRKEMKRRIPDDS